MAGVFGVTPLPAYPSWAQGLEQGTGAIANAILQRRQLDLQRQQLAMQQAQAGYQPPQQAQVYQPGRLNAPSMEAVGNVPSATPGVSQMGAGAPGSPDAMARTAGSYKTVNQPGYYDLTKSLPYLTSLARVMEMEHRGEAAAQIGAASREKIAADNNATKRGLASQLNGYVDGNGQFVPGVRILGNEQLSNYEYGPNGTRTQSALITQAPTAAARAQSLAERMRHDRATEGAAQQNIGLRQQTAQQKAQQIQSLGQLTPTEAQVWKSAYGSAGYLGLPADSAEARANQAVAALRRSASGAPQPSAPAPNVPQSSGVGGMLDRILGRGKQAALATTSGTAPAPHVPTSGNDPVVLQRHTRAPQGGNAPTLRLGNRPVADNTTATYPKGNNLPASPDAPTAKVSGVSKAAIDAAYAKALKDGWSPADAEAKRQQMYKANGITP